MNPSLLVQRAVMQLAIRYLVVTLVWASTLTPFSCFGQTSSLEGTWDAVLTCPGGPLQFGIEFIETDDAWSCFLINGPERIKIPNVTFDGSNGVVDISHFDSKIEFESTEELKFLKGEWTKRKGVDKWSKLKFAASRKEAATPQLESIDKFLGRWKVQFKSDSDHAVGVFKQTDDKRVLGTFMTTTGDYRFLDGILNEETLKLSCFDGAHAFLFHAKLNEGTMSGEFWSSDSWHDTWTATKDDKASLPDAFAETTKTDIGLGQLSFPNLDGKPMRLDDPSFAGKARLIYVFGSWCPNCHDAATYFAELKKKYADDISILGLAFEHTGDFKRDAEQVKRYLNRHGSSYPVLIAGLSDKKEASKAVPFLDRVRSYPTTVFIDQQNQIQAIHTGFTGPATGQTYVDQKRKFESLIGKMISEVSK